MRLGAPPDPITSGYKISMYSSCSNGLPLRALARGSRCGSNSPLADSSGIFLGMIVFKSIACLTYLNMRRPRTFQRGDNASDGAVSKVRVLAQPPP